MYVYMYCKYIDYVLCPFTLILPYGCTLRENSNSVCICGRTKVICSVTVVDMGVNVTPWTHCQYMWRHLITQVQWLRHRHDFSSRYTHSMTVAVLTYRTHVSPQMGPVCTHFIFGKQCMIIISKQLSSSCLLIKLYCKVGSLMKSQAQL